MPITEALKKLIKTITGKNAVGETIEELVTNLNDNYPEGGGGGDTYETVAGIEVGGMEKDDDLYIYTSETPIEIDVTESDSAFLNSPDMPLQWIPAKEGEEGMVILGYNWGADGPVGSPAYYFEFGPETVAIASDSFDLENTTVKILKKVSGGGSITVDDELSETSENPVQNKVITAALADKMDADEIPEATASNNGKILGVVNGDYAFVDYTVILTDDGQGAYSAALDGDAVTLAELLTMAANHAPLRAMVEIDNGRMISAPITTWQTADEFHNASCAFTAPTINGTTTSVAYAVCENDGTGDVWTVGTV